MTRIFVSTAEASADQHAARLVRALRTRDEQLTVGAVGGSALEAEKVDMLQDMRGRAVMGFWEVFSQLGFYRQTMGRILTNISQQKPDAVVLVDAPSFHLRLAKKIRKVHPDLPIVYYIAPKAWVWKKGRVKAMRRYLTKTLCIFPFEEKWFRERGVDTVYVGNPTRDAVRSADPGRFLDKMKWEPAVSHRPEEGIVSLFPGSRWSEIKYIWPAMAGAVKILGRQFPGLRFAVSLAPGMERETLESVAPIPSGAVGVSGSQLDMLAASTLVIGKSGTTTLEAALVGAPMVVCYAGHLVSYMVVKPWLTMSGVKYVSLPNILCGEKVVEELFQSDANPQRLAAEAALLLASPDKLNAMRSKLLSLLAMLGDESAAERAAREIWMVMNRPEGMGGQG